MKNRYIWWWICDKNNLSWFVIWYDLYPTHDQGLGIENSSKHTTHSIYRSYQATNHERSYTCILISLYGTCVTHFVFTVNHLQEERLRHQCRDNDLWTTSIFPWVLLQFSTNPGTLSKKYIYINAFYAPAMKWPRAYSVTLRHSIIGFHLLSLELLHTFNSSLVYGYILGLCRSSSNLVMVWWFFDRVIPLEKISVSAL
jgi:hypothetical protein